MTAALDTDAEGRYAEAVARRDAIRTAWEAEGSPMLTSGSTGQLRLRATLSCEGCLFSKGDYVMLDDPLVQRIANEYPGVFERASLLVPPS